MRYVFKASKFGSISTVGDEYNTYQPEVRLAFNIAASYDRQNAESVIHMFSELSPIIITFGPSRSEPQYGLRFKGNVLRQVVDILFKNREISASDRSNIEHDIKTFEKSIQRRELVSTELNQGQCEALEMIVSPYIDGILDQVPDLALSIKLCGIGMYRDAFDYSEDLIALRLRVCGVYDQFESLVIDSAQKKDIYDCIWNIWRIYSRLERMEDTYLKLGNGIPHLDAQRECIARVVFKSVNTKLSIKSDRFNEIHEAARVLLKENGLNENIISEIQRPAATSDQSSSYAAQNAILYGLFLERESRRQAQRDAAPPVTRSTNVNTGFY